MNDMPKENVVATDPKDSLKLKLPEPEVVEESYRGDNVIERAHFSHLPTNFIRT